MKLTASEKVLYKCVLEIATSPIEVGLPHMTATVDAMRAAELREIYKRLREEANIALLQFKAAKMEQEKALEKSIKPFRGKLRKL